MIRKEQTIESPGIAHRVDWQTITEASKKWSDLIFRIRNIHGVQDTGLESLATLLWETLCLELYLHCMVHEWRGVCELLKPWTVVKVHYFVTEFDGGKVSCPRDAGGSDGCENERLLVWFLYASLMANSRSNDNHSKKTNSATLQNKSCKSPLKLSHMCLFSLGVNTVCIHQQHTLVRHDLRNVSQTISDTALIKTGSTCAKTRVWWNLPPTKPPLCHKLSTLKFEQDNQTCGSFQHDFKWLIGKISRKYARRFLVNVWHSGGGLLGSFTSFGGEFTHSGRWKFHWMFDTDTQRVVTVNTIGRLGEFLYYTCPVA